MALNTGSTRNAILDALLAKFKNVTPWQTASRRFKEWANVPPEDRPALFVVSLTESRGQGDESRPPYITMDVKVFVYTWTPPNDESVPSELMEDLLDAFDKALAPPPLMGNRQTLGGLVSHCWIEGQTLVVPADLEGDGLAVIPIKILIPS